MTVSFSKMLLFLWGLSLVRVQALPFLKATQK
nr:MAG TPA: Dentin matrix protein 1 (DMP1) [Caudoviricetes sp.]DAN46860.1 MAG TPA: Dentin matrix protein 1 (DMP1) [Caudoviricetes sp.]